MAQTYSNTSHVLPNIPSKFWDNVNHAHPLLSKLIDKNEKQDGGISYAPNRIAAVDSGGAYYAGTSTSAVVTAAQGNNLLPETYTWVYVANPITMLKSDEIIAGDSQLVKIKTLDAKKYSAKMYHLQLLADGVVNGDGTSQKPLGISVFIDPTATFGGVDPAQNTDWVPGTATAQTRLSGPSIIETALNNASWMGNAPTNIYTTRALFSRCTAIYAGGLTYNASADGKQTMGLSSIFIRGAKTSKPVEIEWDDDIAANGFYMLDMDVLHLKQSSIEFMRVQMPDTVDSGLNIYALKNGGIFSAYIIGADLRRTSTGWTDLIV